MDLRHVVVGYEFIDIGIRALNYQNSLGIVATCGTNRLNESLLIFSNSIGQIRSAQQCIGITATHTRLIHTGKDKTLVIILETIGYLSPNLGEFCLGSIHISSSSEAIMLNPSTIPMLVDDDIEIVLDAVIYHLVNTSQPIGIDGASLSFCDVTHHPRTRNTDALETGSLHQVDELLGSLCRLPKSFRTDTGILPVIGSISCLHRITQIPPRIHQGSNIHSCLAHITSSSTLLLVNGNSFGDGSTVVYHHGIADGCRTGIADVGSHRIVAGVFHHIGTRSNLTHPVIADYLRITCICLQGYSNLTTGSPHIHGFT